MSELKATTVYDAYWKANSTGEGTGILVYLKSEADKVIAELKKKLMPCLNGDCILTCEVVEKYGKENRRLKRALWIARAERAKWQSLYYWYAISDKYKSRKFDDVERKCRAKAEGYK